MPSILEMVCRATGMGFAVVSRCTDEHWIALGVRDQIAFGVAEGDELPLKATLCAEVVRVGQPIVINHATEDMVYRGHPIPSLYGFQSYISMPIRRRDGTVFGTLCAIDRQPKRLRNTQTVELFRVFADLIAYCVDADERVALAAARLLDERETGELRERQIAVLGHDLLDPLSRIEAGITALADAANPSEAHRILPSMRAGVVRISALIDNILARADGRAGEPATDAPPADT